MQRIYTCLNCDRKFTLSECWASTSICKIRYNSPLENWKTISAFCPYCDTEFIEETLQEDLS